MELSDGDIVALSPLSYFRIDSDEKRPAVSLGVLSLIPDGSVVDEKYVFRHGSNRYFNGVSQGCMACPDVKIVGILGDREAVTVNRMVLASEYLRTMKVLKG